MIRAHLPSSTFFALDFFTEGQGDYYLVIEPAAKRASVWKRWSEWRGAYMENGYKEVSEVTETNLYMLPPFFQTYVKKWWAKWEA